MAADGSDEKVDDGEVDRKHGAVHYIMEYVIPINLVLLFVFLIILFFWIGPVAIFKWILSYIPKDPTTTHAVILGALIVLNIVLVMPLWPPLMIVTCMVFGFWKGFLIIYIAMVLGAVISFIIGRLFLREPFREYIDSSDYIKIRRMIRVVEAEGNSLKFVFLFRFLYMPIWIRNYVPPMLDISFWHFLLSVLVHGVMICMIFAATGTATKDAGEIISQGGNPWAKMDPKQIMIFVVSGTCTAALSYLAYSEYQKRLEEEDLDADENQPLVSDKA